QHSARVRQRITNGSMDLGHAAQGIGVLHARVVVAVRFADLAVGEQMAEMGGDRDLAGMRADGVNASIEGRGRTAQRFQRHGSGQIAEFHKPDGADERQRADGGDRLGSVQQGEAFLGLEGERSESTLEQGEGGGYLPTFETHLTFTDESERKMRERGEVTAGSDGSGRTPLHPFARTLARSSSMARTASCGSGSPTPQEWLRTRLRWSACTWPGSMRRSESLPNPVLMP